MSGQGHTRSFDDAGFVSGFPPKAEIGRAIYERREEVGADEREVVSRPIPRCNAKRFKSSDRSFKSCILEDHRPDAPSIRITALHGPEEFCTSAAISQSPVRQH